MITATHIHACCYVETTRSEAILTQHRRNAQKRSKGFRKTPYTQALWNGIFLMKQEMTSSLENAIKRGHLLFCWDGSKLPAAFDAAKGGAK